jgi:hypothetical protein
LLYCKGFGVEKKEKEKENKKKKIKNKKNGTFRLAN